MPANTTFNQRANLDKVLHRLFISAQVVAAALMAAELAN
jgi:hypothetical protein